MKKSNLFWINARDIAKGFIVVVFSAVLTVVVNTATAGSLTFDWNNIKLVAIVAGGGYLLKNVFTNSEDKFATKEPPK